MQTKESLTIQTTIQEVTQPITQKPTEPRDNTLDEVETHNGLFRMYSNGEINPNPDYFYTEPINVRENTVYKINVISHICFYNDNTYLSGTLTMQGEYKDRFKTPYGCNKIVISSMISLKSSIKIRNCQTHPVGNRLVVDQNDQSKFQTITDAVNTAEDGDTIYIKNGIYEESVAARYKDIHIIGEDKNRTILQYSNADYSNPPLEMAKGSIENISIYGLKTGNESHAYCMHCDFDEETGQSLLVENVVFINESYQAVGIGLRADYTLEFVDCEFKTEVDTQAFYCHDWDGGSGINQCVILRNCKITNSGKNPTIVLQSQEIQGSYAICKWQGNTIENQAGGPTFSTFVWKDNGLSKNSWMGQTDWHLDISSELNNIPVLNKQERGMVYD